MTARSEVDRHIRVEFKTIEVGPPVASAPIFTADSPPSTVNAESDFPSYSFAASGAPAAVTYSIGSGSLPTGISLTSGGVLSGRASVVGTFTYTVQASNGILPEGVSVSHTLTVSLAKTAITATTQSPFVTYGSPVSLIFSGLPSGATGTVYFINTNDRRDLCNLDVTSGAFSCSPSALLVAGTYPVTAFYSGDGLYDSSVAITTFDVTETAIHAATNLGAAAE